MCALLPILPRVPPLAVSCLGAPPRVSPLLEDADGVLSLHFYFLTARILLAAAQVQHLGSPARLAFGSAPLPRVAKRVQTARDRDPSTLMLLVRLRSFVASVFCEKQPGTGP